MYGLNTAYLKSILLGAPRWTPYHGDDLLAGQQREYGYGTRVVHIVVSRHGWGFSDIIAKGSHLSIFACTQVFHGKRVDISDHQPVCSEHGRLRRFDLRFK